MIKIAVCGAGLRGQFAYAPFTKTRDDIEIVAVADTDPNRLETFKNTYWVPEKMCFGSGAELLSAGKIADAVIISTQDKDHYAQTMKAIELGYDILLEKPISTTLKHCLDIETYANEKGVNIIVCHVLRYTPFYRKVKELVDSKVIGQIVTVEAMENVAHWHQAHSFVRGNWANSDLSSPMILQKCCHDFDIYSWIIDSKVERLSSYGSLRYFHEENAPKNAPVSCLNDCPHRDLCPYDVYKIYLSENTGWPASAISADKSYAARLEALRTKEYGKCVFHCNNNVVDHQTVNMLYENGVTMVFTMSAFTQEQDRTLRIMGTKGEIKASMNAREVFVTSFETGETNVHSVSVAPSGHGGGDFGIMKEFIDVVSGHSPNTNPISASVHSHVIAFAAEESRLTKKDVLISDFILRNE